MMAYEKQYHDELKMELDGIPYSSSTSNQIPAEDTEVGEESIPDTQQIAEDSANMSKVLMSRKKKGLYEAIQVTHKLIPKYVLFFLRFFVLVGLWISFVAVCCNSLFSAFRFANKGSMIKLIFSRNGRKKSPSPTNQSRVKVVSKFCCLFCVLCNM